MVASRSMVKVRVHSETGWRQETNRKRLSRTRFRRFERERVVNFELRVDDFFHVEAFFISNFIAKASFLYVG